MHLGPNFETVYGLESFMVLGALKGQGSKINEFCLISLVLSFFDDCPYLANTCVETTII